MSKTTKKLCYIALLVAVYVLLSMTFTILTGHLCLRVWQRADPLWEGHCDRSHRDDDRDSPDEAAAPGRSGSGLKLRKEAF